MPNPNEQKLTADDKLQDIFIKHHEDEFAMIKRDEDALLEIENAFAKEEEFKKLNRKLLADYQIRQNLFTLKDANSSVYLIKYLLALKQMQRNYQSIIDDLDNHQRESHLEGLAESQSLESKSNEQPSATIIVPLPSKERHRKLFKKNISNLLKDIDTRCQQLLMRLNRLKKEKEVKDGDENNENARLIYEVNFLDSLKENDSSQAFTSEEEDHSKDFLKKGAQAAPSLGKRWWAFAKHRFSQGREYIAEGLLESTAGTVAAIILVVAGVALPWFTFPVLAGAAILLPFFEYPVRYLWNKKDPFFDISEQNKQSEESAKNINTQAELSVMGIDVESRQAELKEMGLDAGLGVEVESKDEKDLPIPRFIVRSERKIAHFYNLLTHDLTNMLPSFKKINTEQDRKVYDYFLALLSHIMDFKNCTPEDRAKLIEQLVLLKKSFSGDEKEENSGRLTLPGRNGVITFAFGSETYNAVKQITEKMHGIATHLSNIQLQWESQGRKLQEQGSSDEERQALNSLRERSQKNQERLTDRYETLRSELVSKKPTPGKFVGFGGYLKHRLFTTVPDAFKELMGLSFVAVPLGLAVLSLLSNPITWIAIGAAAAAMFIAGVIEYTVLRRKGELPLSSGELDSLNKNYANMKQSVKASCIRSTTRLEQRLENLEQAKQAEEKRERINNAMKKSSKVELNESVAALTEHKSEQVVAILTQAAVTVASSPAASPAAPAPATAADSSLSILVALPKPVGAGEPATAKTNSSLESPTTAKTDSSFDSPRSPASPAVSGSLEGEEGDPQVTQEKEEQSSFRFFKEMEKDRVAVSPDVRKRVAGMDWF